MNLVAVLWGKKTYFSCTFICSQEEKVRSLKLHIPHREKKREVNPLSIDPRNSQHNTKAGNA